MFAAGTVSLDGITYRVEPDGRVFRLEQRQRRSWITRSSEDYVARERITDRLLAMRVRAAAEDVATQNDLFWPGARPST